jgi:predicted glycosyltransferase
MSGVRVFFYVQHLLGIGHTVRAAQLTRAMQRAGMNVTYVSGGFDAIDIDLGGARVVRLPPVRAGDAGFKTLVGADGAPIDDAWRERRRAALLATFDDADPDLVLIEMFPFGRWPFRFELLPLLDAAHGRARIVCSLRDVLVAKSEPSRIAAVAAIVERYFDAILVHGDPSFIRLDETYPAAAGLAGKIRYTGYVAPEPEPSGGGHGMAEVIVSAGGGGTGGALMRAALAARPLSSLAASPWRLLAGPNLPAPDREALAAGPGVAIEPVRPDFRALLAASAASISQAGYNTVMDILVTRARSVLVPFSAHGQTEQAFRARRLAARGWAQVVDEETLTPQRLAQALDRAVAGGRPGPANIDLRGAARSTGLLAALAQDRARLWAGIDPHIAL